MKKLNKKFIYGTGSVAMIAGVCIIIMLVNIIASMVTDKFGIKIDVSETKYLSFSDEFTQFIDSVDKEIDVYYMVNPNEVTRVTNADEKNSVMGKIDSNNYRIRIKSIFEKIEKINSNINFEIIDPETNPDLVKDFGNVSVDDLVFSCGKMNNSFNVQDILGYDEVGRQTMNAESKIASMVSSVMRDSKVNVGIVTGHNESDTAAIKKVFDDEAIEYEDINILTDGISEKFDLILIYGPKSDYSVDEINRIEAFLKNGKDMQIYMDKVAECPNLTEYLTTLGIKYSEGYVMETSSKNYTVLDNGKYYILPMWNEHTITKSLTNNIFVPDTVSAEPMWVSKNSIDTYPLLTTTSQTVLSTDQTAARSYCITTISSRITESSIISNVVASGSPYIFDEDIINSNKPFLINCTLWMGRVDDSDVYSANIISNVPLNITENQYNVCQMILVFVIPFIIIIIGLVVWIKRRYL